MKPCYRKTLENTVEKLNNAKGTFTFAVVADSHLDNSVEETCQNILELSELTPIECVLHLGDIMCGGFARATIQRLMAKEIDIFRKSLTNGHFFPARGNHDGFSNPVTGRSDVRLDSDWHKATQYLDDMDCVYRPDGRPYFYVDYPEKKVRLIALNSFFYREVNGDNVKGIVSGYDDAQLEWFTDVALDVGKGWTVVAFSHDAPFKSFDENFASDNPIYNGNAMMDAIKTKQAQNGFHFAVWLVGHYHGDMVYRADGINVVLVASETAYVPTLWDMPEGGYYPQRELDSETEDAWDAVKIDTDNRKLYFFRFGAGEDRVIEY